MLHNEDMIFELGRAPDTCAFIFHEIFINSTSTHVQTT